MKLLMAAIVTLLFISKTHAQLLSPELIQVSAGISIPSYPDTFYDYWKNGFGISAECIYQSKSQFEKIISFSYNRFEFDKDRFFKKLNIENNRPGFTGAASSLVFFGGDIRYLIPGYDKVRPYISGGISVLYSRIDKTTIEYEYSPVVQKSKNNFGLSFPIGAYLEFPYKDKFEMVLSVKHYFGAVQNKEINTNYDAVRLGVIFFLISTPITVP